MPYREFTHLKIYQFYSERKDGKKQMELVRDKRVKDAFMNSTIQNMFDRGELRKDHPLQRKPGRWNKSDKDGLVATVIKGEDIDSVKVCEQLTANGVTLWLIDGLQRLTTLSSYRNGVFKIGSNIEFPVIQYQKVKKDEKGRILKDENESYVYEIIEYDLRGKGYHDLPIELREKFDNYKIDVVKHLDCTDEEIGYNIRRYNKQKSMNASENAVTYMDSTAKEVKKISLNNRFFKDCGTYTETERNNGTIDRIIIETDMCMFHLNDWKKSGKAMGAFVNSNSSKEEFDRLNDNLHRLEKVISEDLNELFTSKDSFIWITLFDKFTKLDIDDSRFAEFLAEFKNNLYKREVDGELFYEIDKDGSTKDKSVISRKLNLLEQLMNDYFQVNKDDLKETDMLEFVRKNINRNTAKEDIEFYNDILDDLTLNVDNSSKLLEHSNKLSLIAVISYACNEDIDLDEWFIEFFRKNHTYIRNQKENYLYMKSDLKKFIGKK